MKNVLLIIALTAIYVVSLSYVRPAVTAANESNITIVAETDDKAKTADEGKKKVKKQEVVKTKAPVTGCCPAKTEVKTGCTETQQQSCAASKVTCTEEKKKDKK